MKTEIFRTLISLVFLSLPGSSWAQEANLGAITEDHPNIVKTTTGLDHGFVFGVGYGRLFRILRHPTVIHAQVSMPWAKFDLQDSQWKLGATIPILGKGHWRLSGRIDTVVRTTHNDINRMVSIGADIRLTGGYVSPSWFAGSLVGFDWALTTHIKHTDAYRETVFSQARDGWYRGTGGTVYMGLYGGYSFGKLDLATQISQPRHPNFASKTIPFQVNISASYLF